MRSVDDEDEEILETESEELEAAPEFDPEAKVPETPKKPVKAKTKPKAAVKAKPAKATPVKAKAKKLTNGYAKPVKGHAKPAKPVKAVKAKGKRKPRTVDPAKLDQFGFRLSSMKSKAAAMYATKSGATLAEVKDKLDSNQFNLLTELAGRGYKIDRKDVGGEHGRNVTKYKILTK